VASSYLDPRPSRTAIDYVKTKTAIVRQPARSQSRRQGATEFLQRALARNTADAGHSRERLPRSRTEKAAESRSDSDIWRPATTGTFIAMEGGGAMVAFLLTSPDPHRISRVQPCRAMGAGPIDERTKDHDISMDRDAKM